MLERESERETTGHQLTLLAHSLQLELERARRGLVEQLAKSRRMLMNMGIHPNSPRSQAALAQQQARATAASAARAPRAQRSSPRRGETAPPTAAEATNSVRRKLASSRCVRCVVCLSVPPR